MIFGRHVTRWLSPYCEGILPAPQASHVAAHLLACQRCHRELAFVRTGSRLAARLRPATLPPGSDLPCWSDIGPLLDAPAARVSAPLWSWAPAVALALVVTSGMLWHRTPAPRAAMAVPAPALEEVAVAAYRGESPPPGSPVVERLVRRWIAGEPVTLVVGAADPGTRQTGPKQIGHRTIDNLHLASWTRDDRRYVLVSRLTADAACTICHTVL
jgi:anti-sigma factor RsiW